MPAALAGLRVVDFSTHLSGPYCTMLLADLGADVVKVERPDRGDEARGMPPFVAGESSPFMLWNRGKRSVQLDVKAKADLATARALARRADVLVENFKPGTAERIGLGWDRVSRDNPRIVYCSISGFGQTGPYRERGGFDLITQAMSGLMSVTGPADGPPHRLPLAISDVAAGMFATIGILSALAAREKTGRGQRVDVSLFESAIALAVYEAAYYFATGEVPPRLGQAHRGSSPYQIFQTKDGWIAVGGAAQHFWLKLCEILGAEGLAKDPRFVTNAARVEHNAELVPILQQRFATEPSAHWLARLEKEGIPAGPVMTYDQVFTDPQVLQRAMVQMVKHPAAGEMRTLGLPIKLSATPGAIRRPAPRLGEHTSEVLREIASPQRPKRGTRVTPRRTKRASPRRARRSG
jgi:crotonobetainyl-CoA:carnitine CoA-transferase CaiB-like acyl-CoA transferase